MAERSADWMRQAERDLESAKALEREGFFEWTCFISQQAAEKAVKAVFQKKGAEAWGHSLAELLKALPESIPDTIRAAALSLDRFYIPSRYPNGWAAGTPGEYITKDDARNAVSNSKAIIRFCHDLLA
jgi:HEPN domain-containing protein